MSNIWKLSIRAGTALAWCYSTKDFGHFAPMSHVKLKSCLFMITVMLVAPCIFKSNAVPERVSCKVSENSIFSLRCKIALNLICIRMKFHNGQHITLQFSSLTSSELYFAFQNNFRKIFRMLFRNNGIKETKRLIGT